MSTDILVTPVESEFDHPSTNHYTLRQLMKYKLGMYPCRRAGSSSCFGTTTFDDAPFWVIRNVFNLRSVMKDVWMNGNTPKSWYFWNEDKHVYKKVYPWGVAWFSKMFRDGHICCCIFLDQTYRRCQVREYLFSEGLKTHLSNPEGRSSFLGRKWRKDFLSLGWFSSTDDVILWDWMLFLWHGVTSTPGFVLLGGYLIGVSLRVLENFVMCSMILAAGSWMLGWMSVA